jgi:SSS family solute:Na+ symporter
VINIFIFFFLLAVQFVGMASIFEHKTGLDYEIALLLSCLLIVVYTTVAGLAGVIATDILQFIVMIIVISVIFIPNLFIDISTFSKLNELPADFLTGTSYGLLFLIGLPLFILPSVSVKLDIWQRIIAAKNEVTAKNAILWSGFGMLFFYLIFPLVGMAVKLHYPDISSKMATFVFIESHTNAFFYGFAIVGLIAALMSSGDSFLNLISISFVKDFVGYKNYKTVSEKKQLSSIQIASCVFGILAMIVSFLFPKIVDLMVLSTSAVVIFVPATFYALFVKKANNVRKAALLSIQLGFITNIIFFAVGVIAPNIIEAKSSFIPAFIVSLCTFFIVKALTPQNNGI